MITREKYKEEFPGHDSSDYHLEQFVNYNMHYPFEESQIFLERHGYKILIKERRYKALNHNDNGSWYDKHDSLEKMLIAAPIEEELPEILPESFNISNYSFHNVFHKVMIQQLLKL